MTPSKRKMVRSFFYLNYINGSLQPTGGKAVIAWFLFLSKTLVSSVTRCWFTSLHSSISKAFVLPVQEHSSTCGSALTCLTPAISVSTWVHFAIASWFLSYPLFTSKFIFMIPTLQPPSPVLIPQVPLKKHLWLFPAELGGPLCFYLTLHNYLPLPSLHSLILPYL